MNCLNHCFDPVLSAFYLLAPTADSIFGRPHLKMLFFQGSCASNPLSPRCQPRAPADYRPGDWLLHRCHLDPRHLLLRPRPGHRACGSCRWSYSSWNSSLLFHLINLLGVLGYSHWPQMISILHCCCYCYCSKTRWWFAFGVTSTASISQFSPVSVSPWMPEEDLGSGPEFIRSWFSVICLRHLNSNVARKTSWTNSNCYCLVILARQHSSTATVCLNSFSLFSSSQSGQFHFLINLNFYQGSTISVTFAQNF